MPSPNQAQTKRDQFMDLLNEYIMQEVSYTLADGAQATEAKNHFDWKRRKAHKAILEFVFPAKKETETEAAPADQHPTESPTPAQQRKSEPVPARKNLYQITGNVADVNTVLIERAELHRLQAENNGLRILASGGIDLFERYSTFKAKCAELEAMLDAVGAGGVGRLMPEPQQDDAPLHCDVCGVECSNPWHFSTETERHKHACDACWDVMKIPGQLVELDHATPAQQEPVAWIEVNRSNWSKFENGQPVFQPGGKIAKGQFYTPPDLTEFV